MIAGAALTLLSVAVGALIFGVYGYGMFVVSPFFIGAVAAYFAHRTKELGAVTTVQIALGANLLGGLSLVAAALEGVLCIVMAAPLAIPVAWVGALLGQSIARLGRRPARHTLSGFALLPIVFATEHAFPPMTTFETYQTIGVNAPPAMVWNAIVKMDTIDEPLALPFRLGVAYPLRGEVLGKGVGATRRGEFSTGIAIERVTEWIFGQRLAFVVENDVPAMQEINPYQKCTPRIRSVTSAPPSQASSLRDGLMAARRSSSARSINSSSIQPITGCRWRDGSCGKTTRAFWPTFGIRLSNAPTDWAERRFGRRQERL